ncbi:MAG: ABC transporter substrate-binding protein, partial [Propionibacterium sp.]|nr:ABC transporter substrate-binding protein [Propionibacterium sp.]
AGWVMGPDGVRVKDGQPLSVRIITYPSRPDLGIIMQIMVSQLNELGISATTSVVDSIVDGMKTGNYDIAMYAQHTAPTGDPGFFLNQFFRTGGANNINGYSSATTDELLDQLGELAPGAERDQLAVQIQHQIHVDQAVFILVDPQWHIGVSDRLAGYQPYGGDYYIVNPQLGLS